MAVRIIGIGGYVPEARVGSHVIASRANVSVQRIIERTGVHERRYAAARQAASDLAELAVHNLGEFDRDRLRYIIVATATPDQPQPSTAASLQGRLGLDGVPAFDIHAVCASFLYGLVVGSGLLNDHDETGLVLVVGADRYSGGARQTSRR